MTWFYLALLAPLLYAVIILLDDNLLRHVYKNPLIATAISGLFGLFTAGLMLFLGDGRLSTSTGLIVLSLVIGLCTVLVWHFYFRSLETVNPSLVAIILTVSPVLLPFIAHFLVGERLSTAAIAGFVIITVSALLYTLVNTKKLRITKPVLSVLIAAILLDAVALASKYIFERGDFYSAYFYISLGVFAGGLVAVTILRFTAKPGALVSVFKSNPGKMFALLAGVELIGMLSELVHNRAVSLGPVSLVNVLENLIPLYVLLIAIVLYPFYPQYFREASQGNLKIKFSLLFVMVAGVYLIVQ